MIDVGENDFMDKSLKIRPAAKSDLPEVMRLYAQPGLDDGKTLPLVDAERIFERMSSYPNYRIYVAVRDERIVGTYALLIMDNLGHLGAPSAIIEDVAVDPTQQRQGIGRAMMHHALRLGKENNCYKVMLSSNLKRGQAHAFYQSLGFERHGYSFRIDVEPGQKTMAP